MRILMGSLKNRLFHQIKASHKMKFYLWTQGSKSGVFLLKTEATHPTCCSVRTNILQFSMPQPLTDLCTHLTSGTHPGPLTAHHPY